MSELDDPQTRLRVLGPAAEDLTFLVNSREVAHLFQVPLGEVQRWCRERMIAHLRPPWGGQYRFILKDVLAELKQYDKDLYKAGRKRWTLAVPRQRNRRSMSAR